MKKLYAVLSCMFIAFATTGLSAQMFVKTGTYVYVKNQPFYVKDYLNLSAGATLYLRHGAQLIQGKTGNSTNTGTGNVSVFQEGTVNNFAYNYWCSPIGTATIGIAGNEPFGIALLWQPVTETASGASAVAPSFDGYANPLSISRRWIYKYITSTTYAQWDFVGAASTIAAGEGFSMKGTIGTDSSFAEDLISNNPGSAQRYDFRGKPNTGDIPVVVAAGQTTLTGNPYPSAINLRKFLTVANNASAVNCTGNAYFWEQDKSVNSHVLEAYRGGYGTYASGTNIYQKPTFFATDHAGNPVAGSYGSGSDYPREFAPVGQGFMIVGTSSNPVMMQDKFREFKKEGVDTHFEKVTASEQTPHFRINAKLGGAGVRQITLAFHPEATDGIDHGMDAESLDATPIDVFFALQEKEFVMEAVPFEINRKIPLGFRSDVPVVFGLTVSEIVNFDDAQNIFVHNKTDNTYHDIKNNIYEINLPEGTHTTQFEITFTDEALNTQNLARSVFDVVQNNDTKELAVANPALLDVKTLNLFDINGKLIFSKSNQGIKSQYHFSTAGISDGVYIVNILNSDNRSFSKKVTVSSHK